MYLGWRAWSKMKKSFFFLLLLLLLIFHFFIFISFTRNLFTLLNLSKWTIIEQNTKIFVINIHMRLWRHSSDFISDVVNQKISIKCEMKWKQKKKQLFLILVFFFFIYFWASWLDWALLFSLFIFLALSTEALLCVRNDRTISNLIINVT